MKHYCAETCNTCDAIYEAAKAAEFVEKGEFNEACKDYDYRCLEWAGMGECDANPGWVVLFLSSTWPLFFRCYYIHLSHTHLSYLFIFKLHNIVSTLILFVITTHNMFNPNN